MNKGINKKNIDKLIEYLKKNNVNYNDGRINLSISSSDNVNWSNNNSVAEPKLKS